MKVLQLHTEFRLPDTFKGNLSQALLLMSKYLEKVAAKKKIKHYVDPDNKNKTIGQWEYEALCDLIAGEKDGITVISSYYIGDVPNMKTCTRCDKDTKDNDKKRIRCPKHKKCPKQDGK